MIFNQHHKSAQDSGIQDAGSDRVGEAGQLGNAASQFPTSRDDYICSHVATMSLLEADYRLRGLIKDTRKA